MNFTGSETSNTLISGETLTYVNNISRNRLFKTNNYWYLFVGNNDNDTIYRSDDFSTWTEIPLPIYDATYDYQYYDVYVSSSDVIYAVCTKSTTAFPKSYQIRYGTYNGSWSWENMSLPYSNKSVSVYFDIDSNGYAHIAIMQDFSQDTIYYTTNSSGSWSSWYTLSSRLGGSMYLLGVEIDSNDNIYIFGAESLSTTYFIYSGSWSTNYWSNAGMSSFTTAQYNGQVYVLVGVYETLHLYYGNKLGFSSTTVETGTDNDYGGSLAMTHDGTNLHITFIGYYDATLSTIVKYAYGSPSSLSTPVTMSNITYDWWAYPYGDTQGLFVDGSRIVATFVGFSQQVYFYLGELDATLGNDEPTTESAGGRFYWYNSGTGSFKAIRNIHYLNEGSFVRARKLMFYGNSEWKRCRL